jgi:hypothetical protein
MRLHNVSLVFLLSTIAAFLLLSCGYKPLNGTQPNGMIAVVIPTVQDRTAYAGSATPLTSALRRKTAEFGLDVESSGASAARLIVAIVNINNQAGQLKVDDRRLLPMDTIWRIEVEARLEDAAGNIIIPEQSFVASGRALVQGSPDLEEARAKDRRTALFDDLAEMIVSYMFIER